MASTPESTKKSPFAEEKQRVIEMLVKGPFYFLNSEYIHKNCETSRLQRDQGNKKYVSSKHNSTIHEEIWISYCMSVATAPNDSEELALAYSNRSAILCHLGKYNECLEDISRALELKYPDNLKAKLFHRKAECLAELKNPECGKACKDAKLWLEKSNMTEESKQKFLTTLGNPRVHKIVHPVIARMDLPAVQMQKELPNASKAIEVKYDKKFGRHIVATKQIKPGEIIVIEKCFAKFLYFKSIYTHCSHCASIAWCGIPCDQCCYAMYCSEKCKKDAWKEYHDIECFVVSKMWDIHNSGITEDLFSIRLAIIAFRSLGGFKNVMKEINIVENWPDEQTKGFLEDGTFRSDHFRSVLSLKYGSKEDNEFELLDTANLGAKAVELIAKSTTFFSKTIDADLIALSENDAAVTFGALVARNKQMIRVCAHTVEETTTCLCKSAYMCEVNHCGHIGMGIYPFCTLFNHSCTPSVDKFQMEGTKLVVFASHPIKKGEQIFDNYGPMFLTIPRQERQKMLEMFDFKCTCNACVYKWPLMQELPSISKYLDNHSKLYDEFAEVLKRCNAPYGKEVGNKITFDLRAAKSHCDLIETLYKVTILPTKELYKAVHMMKKMYTTIFGTKLYSFPKSC